jgi:cytosine/adenosine deaminase-related metal-dependent hydrolase
MFLLLSSLASSICFAGTTNHIFNGSGYPVKICDASYAGRPANCTVNGKGSALRIKGIIISQDTILVGGEIRINAQGKITDVGCNVSNKYATTINCPGGLISPGFIDLHEHIDYSYLIPTHPLAQHWHNRSEWRAITDEERGFSYQVANADIPAIRTILSERAMLRHMLSGTTALAGALQYKAFTRNLGLTNTPLGTPNSNAIDYIIDPITNPNLAHTPCVANQNPGLTLNPTHPSVMHVGEGSDQAANCEIDDILDALKNKKTPTVFVHSVALNASQIKKLAKQHISVDLSPQSNFMLYGETAPIKALKKAGVNLALGTDWSPSGSLTMLDEMRVLANYNHLKLNDFLTWADIHRMATYNSALAIGLQDKLGSLSKNKLADIILIDTKGSRSFGDTLKNSNISEIIAVFIAGKGATFPTSWLNKIPATLENCETDVRKLCGHSHTICGIDAHNSLSLLFSNKDYKIDDGRLCKPTVG